MIVVDDTTIQENLQRHIEHNFSQTKDYTYKELAYGGIEGEYNPIFTHVISSGEEIYSQLFFFILPLVTFCHNLYNLKIKYVVRSRVFWQPATIREQGYLHDKFLHRDFELGVEERGTNFLYYCNDSDGGTYIYNEDLNNKNLRRFVEHKKGRFAIFDARLWHAGSKPTKNTRLVINVNSILE